MKRIVGGAAAGLALAAGLSACGSTAPTKAASRPAHKHSATATPSPAADKYTLTWTKDPGATTCTDWMINMTERQRFAMAASYVTAVRNKMDHLPGEAPDRMVRRFERDMARDCLPHPHSKVQAYAIVISLKEFRYFKQS